MDGNTYGPTRQPGQLCVTDSICYDRPGMYFDIHDDVCICVIKGLN